MAQQSSSDMEYSQRKRVTRREEFLDIMDEIIPWEEWVSLQSVSKAHSRLPQTPFICYGK